MKTVSAAAAASHGWNMPCKTSVMLPTFYILCFIEKGILD